MTIEPRLMSGADAAAYCGVTPTTFSAWVASGKVPKPLSGTRRWDRRALDIALDKLSGIEAPPAAGDPYEIWKRQQVGDECPLEKWVREDEARQEIAAERAWEQRYDARKSKLRRGG